MKKSLILTLFLVITGFASAQTVLEAFRYAFINYNGTARFSAAGGAFTSLGGDITVASTNPAGLAIFRKSTGSFTPGISMNKLTGKGYSNDATNFIFPSFGFVFASPALGESNFKTINFGFTYTQGANYNNLFSYKEMNSKYTLLDDIASDLNKFNSQNTANPILPKELENGGKFPSLASLAYNTILIDYVNDNGKEYYSPNILATETVNLTDKNDVNGQAGEYAFSVATNYLHKLYIGATIGLQSIYYERINNYHESVQNRSKNNIVEAFYYDRYLQVVGTGLNFKIGAIYRANNNIRFGFAVHTPTLFSMEEHYNYSLESVLASGKGSKKTNPENGDYATYSYEYYTPWRLSVGGSYLFGRTGFISVDYEWIDYSTMQFSGDGLENTNTAIKNTYGSSNNIKIGTEIRLTPQFFVRGGYNYISNMYKETTGKEQISSIYSGGLGYKGRSFFIDCSYQHFLRDLNIQQEKDIITNKKYTSNIIKLTVGFTF